MAVTGWRKWAIEGGAPLAVAGALVALAVSAVNTRMAGEWGAGTFLAIYSVAAVAVLGSGLLAADGDDRPDGAATALIVSGLLLLLGALGTLAELVGDGGAGAVALVAVVFAAIAAFVSVRCATPVAALIAAVALGVAAVAAVVLFDPDGIDAFRWVAAALAAVFAAASLSLRDERMSVQLVNAAGIAILLLAISVPGELYVTGFNGFAGDYGGADWWEAISLFGAVNLVAYAVLRREPGPGYLGAATFLFFLTGALGSSTDASLEGWPLVLILLAVMAVAVAVLRPRQA